MNKKTYVFEVLNIVTGEQFTGIGKTLREACQQVGHNIRHCRCISRAEL